MKKTTDVWECTCDKCGYVWTTKSLSEPEVCSKCKSKKWNEESQYKEVATAFKERVQEKKVVKLKQDVIAGKDLSLKLPGYYKLKDIVPDGSEQELVQIEGIVEEDFDFGA